MCACRQTLNSPIFWSDEELVEIEGSNLHDIRYQKPIIPLQHSLCLHPLSNSLCAVLFQRGYHMHG